jgi:adenosyl cobinamide kinase/adenosyl cobinamide phosphate guanylyltransferase
VTSILAGRPASSVVVSNEVGLGIVPANALARTYRDVLGRVNASFAARASRSLFVVAGRALPLEEVTPT